MIIITAPAHNYLESSLKKMGHEVIYEPTISYKELSEKIEHATGLIVTTRLKIDKQLLLKTTKLKWIGRLGSGMELIDTEFAHTKNIQCFSSPEGNCNAVAEHALGLLLAAKNNIVKSVVEVKEGKWIRNENRGTEIKGATIGIIGYGNTGQAFAKLLSVFGGTILANDKYKNNFGNSNVREAEIEQICKYADIISFHLPLSKETENIANNDFFNSLQNKPFIINTSRGNVIDTSALINALKNDKICGAALDVLENEHIETLTTIQKEQLDFLKNHPKVLITPHIAGYTHEAFFNMSDIIIKKLNTAGLL